MVTNLDNTVQRNEPTLPINNVSNRNETEEATRQLLDEVITKWVDENPHTANKATKDHLHSYINKVKSLEKAQPDNLPSIDLSRLSEDDKELLKDGLNNLKVKMKNLAEGESMKLNFDITTYLTVVKILSDIIGQHLDHLKTLSNNQIPR